MSDYLRLWLGGRRGFFTHVHHSGVPIEQSEDILERLRFIDAKKDLEERALRKALIRRVPDRLLPPSLLKAAKAYEKATAAYDRAQKKFMDAPFGSDAEHRARDKYQAAEEAYSSAKEVFDEECRCAEWDEIHAKVCHPRCPWTPDFRNIFSRGKSIEVLSIKG